jgi:hypothetical protein
MIFQKGKEQRVNTNNKTIFGDVEFDEEFPVEFGIWDLKQLLSVISLFTDPEIDFEKEKLVIKEGKRKVNYFYSDIGLIKFFKNKVTLPNVDIQFNLSKDTLTQLHKVAKVFNGEYIAVVGDKEKIYLQTINPKNDQQSSGSFEVGETDKEFRMVISMDRLIWVDGEYVVKISKEGIAKATCQDTVLSYIFTCDSKSEFKG